MSESKQETCHGKICCRSCRPPSRRCCRPPVLLPPSPRWCFWAHRHRTQMSRRNRCPKTWARGSGDILKGCPLSIHVQCLFVAYFDTNSELGIGCLWLCIVVQKFLSGQYHYKKAFFWPMPIKSNLPPVKFT